MIGSPGGGARVEQGRLGPRATASTTSWSSAPGGWGPTIAGVLLERGLRVRVVDAQRERVAEIAEVLPKVRAFHAEAFDPEFLERERIGRARAGGVLPQRRREEPLRRGAGEGARPATSRSRSSTTRPRSPVYARGGVDVTVNPRQVTAEEMVRFAHDPRIRQIAMLEDDRFEILDLGVRPDSELIDKPFNRAPGDRLGHRRGDPQRLGALPAQLRHPARGRPRDRVRRVEPRVDRREGALSDRVRRARERGAARARGAAARRRCGRSRGRRAGPRAAGSTGRRSAR